MNISSTTWGLGDGLLLTAICKIFPNKIDVHIPPDKQRFEKLFKGLANVKISSKEDCDKFAIPDIGGGHYTTRKLRYLFGSLADSLDNRPLVLYFNEEDEQWASEYLKDKNNPVIFTPTCSPQWANVRNIPHSLAVKIYDNIVKCGGTPIVCQSKDNYYDIGEHKLFDLEIGKYIALLRQAKMYHGANTGDYHLAVAVGCNTTVYEPEDGPMFTSSEWDYVHPNHKYIRWNFEHANS